jgi:NAD+ synthase (glutamine-hydrolysing)
MLIALAQISPVVGDFENNVKQILAAYTRAVDAGARLLVTPELSVSGYPPHDLMDRPEMFTRTEAALETLTKATRGKKTALLVGHVQKNPKLSGRAALNSVSILEDGITIFTQAKTLLPTYDVFDEARYFEPADSIQLWQPKGEKTTIALAICEDLWGNDEVLGRKIYDHNPVTEYKKLNPGLLISASSSPYEYNKGERREELHAEIARDLNCPLIYVNQVGATDDVLFDGASFAMNADGKIAGKMAAFQPGFSVFDTELGKFTAHSELETQSQDSLDVMMDGLILGIRAYFERTGFKLGVIGLSGGIDSAVVSALAVQALGNKNVFGVAMPSQFSSSHSLADAEDQAKRMAIPFEVRPIKFLFSAAKKEIGEARGELAPIAQENLQARLRGMTLMALANHYGALVLTTGNKSEIATGYCTLYGDMCGAIAPIGDVYKTRVYELAHRINARAVAKGEIPPIPDSTLKKAPSAELRPDQKDQDSLPPYDQLDALLEDYLEKYMPISELKKKHGEWTSDILKKIEINEYKRRQAAPVLKVSTKAFGIGRRVPIAKVWDQNP